MGRWLGQFTEAGWVVPLSDYIGSTKGEYASTVTELVWKAEQELYGNIYTIPDGMMVKGVFVRKDWAKEVGLNLDMKKGWTYAEYFDAVYKLTDPSKNRYGTSFRGSRGAFDLVVHLKGSMRSAYAAMDFVMKDQEAVMLRVDGSYLDGLQKDHQLGFVRWL